MSATHRTRAKREPELETSAEAGNDDEGSSSSSNSSSEAEEEDVQKSEVVMQKRKKQMKEKKCGRIHAIFPHAFMRQRTNRIRRRGLLLKK